MNLVASRKTPLFTKSRLLRVCRLLKYIFIVVVHCFLWSPKLFQAHKYREPEIFSLRMIFILTDRFVETDCYALLPKPWSAGQNDFQESEPLVQTDFSGISSWRHYGAKSVTFLSESLIRARRHNCFIKSTARTFLVMYHLVTPDRSLTESTKMYSSIKQIPAFPILTRAGFWRWPGFDCIQIPTQLSIW